MIQIKDSRFLDEHGRRLLLRGVNLSGSSKIPFQPDGATHIREGFFDHRNISFIGRPFPLQDADEHFRRLRAWGFTFLRLLTTWEAIEHAGPGIYDEAYLDYLRDVVKKAGEYGITLFIDPHQDVWSRFSGGDGAPGWTLEAVGFDMTHFAETGAAIVHATHGDPLPPMIWPTNARKLAAATMFTLFFGGNDFAPNIKIAGEPAEEYLQRHYIDAICQLASRLSDLPNVLGYDTLNEPLPGYIGMKDLNQPIVSFGVTPTPFQGMLLGYGLPQKVQVWELKLVSIRSAGLRELNNEGARAWQRGYDCIWKQNGVWDLDSEKKPQLLRPDHFAQVKGRPVDFIQDYYYPFASRFAAAIRKIDPRALIFIETEAGKPPPYWDAEDAQGIVFAPHWYDGLTVVKKSFTSWVAVDFMTHKPVFSSPAIRRSILQQLQTLKRYAEDRLSGVPTVIGEFGIPFDMENGKAYRTGDFRAQINALDRSYRAIESLLLHSTLWNYTPDNNNVRGDKWNGEDFSIFSPDQRTDFNDNIHAGGRALEAALRPYPRATAGEPLNLSFNLRRRVFKFSFRHDPSVQVPTEIFIPNYQYPHGYQVEVSDGVFEINRQEQLLTYDHTQAYEKHTIHIRPID